MARTLKTRSELKAKTLRKSTHKSVGGGVVDAKSPPHQKEGNQDLLLLLWIHFISISHQISVSGEAFSANS